MPSQSEEKGPVYRIAIADDNLDQLKSLAMVLEQKGHAVVVQAKSGDELIAGCQEYLPDLVIADVRMDGTDGIEAARQIWKRFSIPSILVTGLGGPDVTGRVAGVDGVFSYLQKPVEPEGWEAAIAITARNAATIRGLAKECAEIAQKLEDRKFIERAKDILAGRLGIEGDAAYKQLQQLASEENRKLVDMARSIIAVERTYQLRRGS